MRISVWSSDVCSSDLEHAPTTVQQVALLERGACGLSAQVIAVQALEITFSRHHGAKIVTAALAILGNELVDVGDREGAMACLRLAVGLDRTSDELGKSESVRVMVGGRLSLKKK